MKKILVIGSGGSGKSTFATRLGELLDIEVKHLDRFYWQARWQKPSKEEWLNTVRELASEASWIMTAISPEASSSESSIATRLSSSTSRGYCVFGGLQRDVYSTAIARGLTWLRGVRKSWIGSLLVGCGIIRAPRGQKSFGC